MKFCTLLAGAALAGLLLFSAVSFAGFATDDEAYTLFDLLRLQVPVQRDL